MRILIDGRMYGLENAGIGRYIISLIDQIEKIDNKNDYYLLLRKKYFQSLHFNNPKFHKILSDYSHYSLEEQLFLPIQLFKLKPDLVHFPHFNFPIFYRGKFMVTIHDLIKHTFRGSETTTRQPMFYWLKYWGYKLVFGQSVKRATTILVPSKAVKGDLLNSYKIPEEKVVVTYEGVEDKFKIKNAKILGKYGIKKPFVVYTGSLYPHKNIERLIAAIKCFNDLNHDNERLSLIIICARNVFRERIERKIEKTKSEEFINFAGFVQDDDLVAIYNQAEAFIFPTLSEGFGLPGLEAMACGCPVVCSDIPVLKEVYGEAALYFDPLKPEDIARKILKLISSKNLQKELIRKGFEQAKKYSWKKMARQTISEYHKLKFC